MSQKMLLTLLACLEKPVWAISRTIYALTRYCLRANNGNALLAARRSAAWLFQMQNADGSLPGKAGDTGAHLESTLDAWWALHSTGFNEQANRVSGFLLDTVCDSQMGRFKSGAASYHIFLDNQTWGAAFLRAVGYTAAARRALSYAQST